MTTADPRAAVAAKRLRPQAHDGVPSRAKEGGGGEYPKLSYYPTEQEILASRGARPLPRSDVPRGKNEAEENKSPSRATTRALPEGTWGLHGTCERAKDRKEEQDRPKRVRRRSA